MLTSLRSRLLGLVVVAVVPAFALSVYGSIAHRRAVAQEVHSRARDLALLGANDVQRTLSDTGDLLERLATVPAVRGMDPATAELSLRHALQARQELGNLGLADLAGTVLASARPTEEPVIVTDRRYFTDALATGRLSLGDYQIGRITHRPGLNCGLPVRDESGEIVGVLFAAIDLGRVQRLAADVALPPESCVTLVDRDGTVLAHHPDPDRRAGSSIAGTPLFEALRRATSDGLLEADGLDGEPRLFAVAPLAGPGGGPGAFLGIGFSARAAYAEANRVLVLCLSLTGVVAVLTLAAAWYWGRAFLLRDVERLGRTARRIGGGDLATRTGIPRDGSEMGVLAGAIDDMACELEAGRRRALVAQRELDDQRAHAARHDRLHALGEMAAGVAHDFNNLLTPMVGFTELLLQRPEVLDDRERALRYLRLIHGAAGEASRTVRRLREFHRPADGDAPEEAVDVNETVEEALLLTQSRWRSDAEERGIEIRVERQLRPVPRVGGRPSELRDAVVNLLLNSVDAMPGGGTLHVSTELEARGVVLRVRDSGVGMDATARERCLEPFFTTKGEHGSGLGLPLVYGVARRHGGTLGIDSEPGRGTTVTLVLPPLEGDEEPSPRAEPVARELSLLVVDDEDVVREVVTAYLEEDRHCVTAAAAATQALDLFRSGRFDAVITDRSMPGMNGDQLTAELRALDPRVPVIMLTGFGDRMLEAGDCPPGVDLVLAKPPTLDDLRRALERVVRTCAAA